MRYLKTLKEFHVGNSDETWKLKEYHVGISDETPENF
jgi:hypothetical protein